LQSSGGITLIGGGCAGAETLAAALALAPLLVAADGGADTALALGHVPDLAIGDFDSISTAARAALGPGRLHHLTEQESTDFDKALRHVAADFTLAVGFAGARLDHTLAAFNVLARHPGRRCLLLGTQDVAFLAPPALRLRLDPGTRLSLFPMAPVTGQARGLRWPLDGHAFAPGGVIGTSNEVTLPEVELRFSAPAMLVFLPAECLRAALSGLGCLPPDAA
jgi:thiamine pyrophosphokinase